MDLKKILIGIENLKVKGSIEVEIEGIESDSNKIKDRFMFVAIKGMDADGHEYINDAMENGATVVMIEEGCDLKKIKPKPGVTIVMAKDTRKALAICASNFYKNPSKKLNLIGITGTKGKTTTAFMLKAILEKEGKNVGLISTIGTYINGNVVLHNERTTPDSIELQKIFAQMVEEKVEYAIMEVSSQSLKMHRVDCCDFNMVLFTNLSEDHISLKEHANMREYFEAKLKLFEMCKIGYTNADDIYGAKIPELFPQNEILTYGIDNHADLLAKDITVTNTYADFKVKLGNRNERVKVAIPGRFSVYNAIAAISLAIKIGVSVDSIKNALLEIKVPGRSELVENEKEIPIMIDYAHSPKSLESILKTLKNYTKGRVICVFGCGGDRDKNKRKIMGEISGKIADYTIITSDNPRSEEPTEIIKEIERGIKETKGQYEVIVDRTEAIKKAIKMAGKRDIVLLAGKGHETYQEINGEKLPYDERNIINEIMNKSKK